MAAAETKPLYFYSTKKDRHGQVMTSRPILDIYTVPSEWRQKGHPLAEDIQRTFSANYGAWVTVKTVRGGRVVVLDMKDHVDGARGPYGIKGWIYGYPPPQHMPFGSVRVSSTNYQEASPAIWSKDDQWIHRDYPTVVSSEGQYCWAPGEQHRYHSPWGDVTYTASIELQSNLGGGKVPQSIHHVRSGKRQLSRSPDSGSAKPPSDVVEALVMMNRVRSSREQSADGSGDEKRSKTRLQPDYDREQHLEGQIYREQSLNQAYPYTLVSQPEDSTWNSELQPQYMMYRSTLPAAEPMHEYAYHPNTMSVQGVQDRGGISQHPFMSQPQFMAPPLVHSWPMMVPVTMVPQAQPSPAAASSSRMSQSTVPQLRSQNRRKHSKIHSFLPSLTDANSGKTTSEWTCDFDTMFDILKNSTAWVAAMKYAEDPNGGGCKRQFKISNTTRSFAGMYKKVANGFYQKYTCKGGLLPQMAYWTASTPKYPHGHWSLATKGSHPAYVCVPKYNTSGEHATSLPMEGWVATGAYAASPTIEVLIGKRKQSSEYCTVCKVNEPYHTIYYGSHENMRDTGDGIGIAIFKLYRPCPAASCWSIAINESIDLQEEGGAVAVAVHTRRTSNPKQIQHTEEKPTYRKGVCKYFDRLVLDFGLEQVRHVFQQLQATKLNIEDDKIMEPTNVDSKAESEAHTAAKTTGVASSNTNVQTSGNIPDVINNKGSPTIADSKTSKLNRRRHPKISCFLHQLTDVESGNISKDWSDTFEVVFELLRKSTVWEAAVLYAEDPKGGGCERQFKISNKNRVLSGMYKRVDETSYRRYTFKGGMMDQIVRWVEKEEDHPDGCWYLGTDGENPAYKRPSTFDHPCGGYTIPLDGWLPADPQSYAGPLVVEVLVGKRKQSSEYCIACKVNEPYYTVYYGAHENLKSSGDGIGLAVFKLYPPCPSVLVWRIAMNRSVELAWNKRETKEISDHTQGRFSSELITRLKALSDRFGEHNLENLFNVP